MSFLDIVFLVVIAFILIIVVNVSDYIHQQVFVPMNDSSKTSTPLNQSQYDTIEAQWQQNKNFFDNSFTAIFIVAGIASVLMAAMLAPYPAALAVFLLINLVTLFLYDGLNTYLTAFLTGSLNTGAMSYAVAFWQSGVPKLIIGLNILMAVVLFGKKVTQ
jgi:hypothetical protein